MKDLDQKIRNEAIQALLTDPNLKDYLDLKLSEVIESCQNDDNWWDLSPEDAKELWEEGICLYPMRSPGAAIVEALFHFYNVFDVPEEFL